MQHTANMNNRDLICSGHKVSNHLMSADDLEWCVKFSGVIAQDENGRWYHTKITARDRATRNSFWNPDTGPWRKGVNY